MPSLKRALLAEETEFHNIALDLLGIVPVYGEYFDATNAIDYFRKGDNLLGTLCVISMIPLVGDFIGKGGKVVLWLEKIFPKAAVAVVKYGPDAINMAKKLRDLVRKYKPMIVKLLDNIQSHEGKETAVSGLAPYVSKMREVIDILSGDKQPQVHEPDGQLKSFHDAVSVDEKLYNGDLMRFDEARMLLLAGLVVE